MEAALNRILEQRRARPRLWRGRQSVVVSLLAHLSLVAAIFIGPLLFAEKREPVNYVDVTVVQASALPQPKPEPPPQKPAPPPPPPPPPKPEPEVPALEPTKKKPEPPEPEPSPQETAADSEEEPTPDLGLPQDGPTAVQGLDDPDFTYGYYVSRMLTLIRSHWTRPPVGGEIQVVVHFRILRNGHVDELRIVEPSGIESFDLAGLRAISSASPLPPLPQGYRKPSLGVTLIMR